MLTPAAAARAILQEVTPQPVVDVRLNEALNRVLATDVASPIDLPAWDNSAMDGYAVRSEDIRGSADDEGSLQLHIIETIPAGAFPTKAITTGECSRIFTGAPLPEGCDGVIRQEDTTALAGDLVRIDKTRDAGRNIRLRGEDIRKDSLILSKGTPLGPAEIGVLASVARDPVRVHDRPRISVIASGDEIADMDERDAILRGEKIASSNTYTLTSMIRLAGAEPANLGIARDDPEDVRAKLTAALSSDLIVTSAGVSVGEHDYIRSVLDDLGIDLKFWRIGMRPGAPVGFGLLQGVPWIGLPGNPVSTMVTFELFVRPAVRKMLGHSLLFRRTTRVRVGDPIKLGTSLRHFMRVTLSAEEGALVARITGAQGSGILTSMVKAQALLIVPENRPTIDTGETLDAIVLDDPHHVPDVPF